MRGRLLEALDKLIIFDFEAMLHLSWKLTKEFSCYGNDTR